MLPGKRMRNNYDDGTIAKFKFRHDSLLGQTAKFKDCQYFQL